MRNRRFPQLPKMRPLIWVLHNKSKVTLGGRIDFEKYVDMTGLTTETVANEQVSRIEPAVKRMPTLKEDVHYLSLGPFENR